MAGGSKQLYQENVSMSSHRRPERPSLSCTECRRRKQKGKPCTNCSRRFPQPICEYDTKVSKRSKRAGAQISEDPTLGVTDTNGPYSHLKHAGVQDAILQIELPTRIIKGKTSVNTNPQRSWVSGSDVGTHHNGPDPWKPFIPLASDHHTAVASRIMNRAIRKIVQERFQAIDADGNGDFDLSPAGVMRVAQGAMPPSKPLGSYFDDLRYVPMAPTRLNNELVRTHLQLTSRFKVSIDGNPGPDNDFMRRWIPFTIQDPLMLHVILYTSACFLQETGHLPKTLSMAYKGTCYQMLNNSLRAEETQTSDVVVLAVEQLVMDEWFWGATNDLRAHMLGLKMIIRMRGGLQKLGMHGFLAKMILMHDITIALAHETEPMMFDRPGFEFEDPVMVPFQSALNSPFLSGWPTFASSSISARMHPSTAAMLDDLRILIEAVISGLDANFEHKDPAKLASTIAWVQQRLFSLPQEIVQLPEKPPRAYSEGSSSPAMESTASSHSSPADSVSSSDPIYSWIRKTSLIYCRAISQRQPFSTACTEADFQYLWAFTWRFQSDMSLTTVGILLWVATAITPSSHGHAGSRFLKTVLSCLLMNMGVDNWHVAVDAARRALRLQAWLRGGEEKGWTVQGGEAEIEKHGFALKEKLGNFGLTAHYEDAEDDGG